MCNSVEGMRVCGKREMRQGKVKEYGCGYNIFPSILFPHPDKEKSEVMATSTTRGGVSISTSPPPRIPVPTGYIFSTEKQN